MEATIRDNIRPFSISFILHALLFILALALIFDTRSGSRRKGEPIEIQSITEKPSATQSRTLTRKQPHPRSESETQPRSIPLSALGMRMDYSRPATQEKDFYQPEPEARPGNLQPADDWDLTNPDPRVARFNQYIYNTVQGWLDRDAPLYQGLKLTGTVRLKIWFSADGEYLETETVFEAEDPDFKKIVQRVLQKSFANPVPKMFLTQKHKFFIERTVVLRERY